jgi:DNA-directed RNA polymerase specialized sigma24 family protein
MIAFVKANISSVPPRELDVFYKLYFEGRSKKDAASALGVSVNTLSTLLRRLRQRLKRADLRL